MNSLYAGGVANASQQGGILGDDTSVRHELGLSRSFLGGQGGAKGKMRIGLPKNTTKVMRSELNLIRSR